MKIKYVEAETIGRNCFANAYPTYTKTYSENRFDFWDVSGYTSNNSSTLTIEQPYIAEIKQRKDIKHDRYNTVMLEVIKYQNLINYTQQSGIPSFYFCVYDDTALIANLSKINLENCVKKQKLLPETSDPDTNWIWKDIYEVPLKYFKKVDKGGKYYKHDN